MNRVPSGSIEPRGLPSRRGRESPAELPCAVSATPPPSPEEAAVQASEAPESPWRLLTTNPVFTRLWLSQVLSMAGDWLSFVALLSLLLELTGSGMSVSALLLCTSVPSLLVAPFAGVVADRCDRRRVMIAADLVRMLCVLGFLLLQSADGVWLAYLLTAAIAVASGFFAPAAAAALPNLVRSSQLTAANALAGATGGVMTALAAWLGGWVSANLGRPVAFGLDALSFLISALVILSVRQPFSAGLPAKVQSAGPSVLTRTLQDLREGGSYAWNSRPVLALLLLKIGAGLGGGVLALLSVVPIQVLKAGDYGVGVLYASRGLGTLVGAALASLVAGARPRVRALAAAWGLVASGLLCVAFGASTSLAWAAGLVFGAFLGSGVQWVLSGALLQRVAEDRLLGRVMALDNAGMTLTASLSTLLCGWGLVAWGPRPVAGLVGAAVVLSGLVWLAFQAWLRPLRFEAPAQRSSRSAR